MPTYAHPGVYIEEIPSGVNPIEGVGTSTSAFLGFTPADKENNTNQPTLISSWDDYEDLFGGLFLETGERVDDMGRSVFAYFMNGGSKAYIVRLENKNIKEVSTPSSDPAAEEVVVIAKGGWANGLNLELEVTRVVEQNSEIIDVEAMLSVVEGEGEQRSAVLSYQGISISSESVVADVGLFNLTFDWGKLIGKLKQKEDKLDLTFADTGLSTPKNGEYLDALSKLQKYRDVNILLLPGNTWESGKGKANIEAAISHCEKMKNRMVIVDIPKSKEVTDQKNAQDLDLTTSTYAVTYYPWVEVRNQRFIDGSELLKKNVLVPPSGYAAGMWGKTDSRRGVWKAPAGVETGILGLTGLEYSVENDEQDFLNPEGINAFRKIPGYGPVIWGARTRSTRANPEWRYVPVRRTAIFIEESIYNGIQWAVFEPNDHLLWSSLRANIGSFMDGLYRSNAFQGEKASDAYFVRCGLNSTMKQGDIDAGKVIVVVGFAPLKPAEFVIVRIQQKAGQE